MNPNLKIAGVALTSLAVAVSASVIGTAIYTRTKIDIDWKNIAIASTVGLIGAFVAVKIFKAKQPV
ncbi:MAG: hypothetical protein HC892_01590 [Saprospiraceae bacterium]|nr:hypothetical protein [Saprospiraceae bacterium]